MLKRKNEKRQLKKHLPLKNRFRNHRKWRMPMKNSKFHFRFKHTKWFKMKVFGTLVLVAFGIGACVVIFRPPTPITWPGTLTDHSTVVRGYLHGHRMPENRMLQSVFYYQHPGAVSKEAGDRFKTLFSPLGIGTHESHVRKGSGQHYDLSRLTSAMKTRDTLFHGYVEFESSGIEIASDGSVHLDGQHMGILNVNPQINRLLDKSPHGQLQIPSDHAGRYSLAMTLGEIHGKNISILVPEKLVPKFQREVRSNDYRYIKNWTKRYSKPDAKMLSTGYNDQFAKSFQHWMRVDINQARNQNHVSAYKNSNRMKFLTGLRALQADEAYRTEPSSFVNDQQAGHNLNSDAWIHGAARHESTFDDLQLLHLVPINHGSDDNTIGECAGNLHTGKQMLQDMHFKQSITAKTPKELAHRAVYGMISHDHFAKNAHRKTLLSSKFKELQIGVKDHVNSKGQHVCTYVIEVK